MEHLYMYMYTRDRLMLMSPCHSHTQKDPLEFTQGLIAIPVFLNSKNVLMFLQPSSGITS